MMRTEYRPFGQLAVACVLALVGVCRAVAQTTPPLTREPERYAFVAGISDYTTRGSSFGDLLTACDEAMRMRTALLGMGWSAGNIYPNVKLAVGKTETPELVREAICDLTNSQLQDGLKAFSGLLLDHKGNPFGLVYVGSHGAQSNGQQYVFGSDATFDFDTELSRAVRAPRYKTLADSGVPVLEIFDQLSGINSRAVLIIIDACRNNAALDRYREKAAKAGNVDPKLLNRLSAGYFVKQGEVVRYDKLFSNIVVLFSTRPDRQAAGAAPGATTPFTATVLELMKDDDVLKESGAVFASEAVRLSIQRQFDLAEYEKQIPDRIGVMPRKPVFCFKNCPQALSVWPQETVTVINAPAITAPKAQETVAARPVRPPGAAKLLPVAFAADPPPAAAAAVAPAPASTGPYTVAPALAAPLRSMNVDVFYCLGDSATADRQTEARRYAERLRSEIPAERAINGYYLDRIRLRSFNPAANPAMARGKQGVTIWIDQNSPLEAAWSKTMATYGPPLTVKVNVVTRTPDYISVFFCSDLTAVSPTSTIYTQVARRPQVPRAAELVAQLQGALPGLRFEPKVDPVDDRFPGKSRMPTNSEVRYYRNDQRGEVDRILAQLNARLTYPARAVRLRSPSAALNPVIEVWLGLQETASWTAGAQPEGARPGA